MPSKGKQRASRQAQLRSRRKRGKSHSTTLSYPYLGSELKRIAIVSGIVVVALLGFSFI